MKKSIKKTKKKERSARVKKVTVKFFVNKAVQPMTEGRTKRYPLYVLITYDRRNTMMRCHYGQWYKNLDEVEHVHYPGLLAMEERIIRKTIAYEMAQRGEDFDLKGIYKKYEQYATGIHALVEGHLKTQLWSILSRMEPYGYVKALNFTEPNVDFTTLYTIAGKIYKKLVNQLPKRFEQQVETYQVFANLYQEAFFQYTFPTVIEWIDGSSLDEYQDKLVSIYGKRSPEIKKSIEFINTVVDSVLENDDTK